MTSNLHKADRAFRAIIGIMIIAWGVLNESYFGIIGAVLLVTSVISFCPLYRIFNISTCPKNCDDKDVIS